MARYHLYQMPLPQGDIEDIVMKTLLTLATTALALASASALAQNEATGVSTPPPAVITASPDEAPAPAAAYKPKPSAAVGYASPSATQSNSFGPYVPYAPAGQAMPLTQRDPDANIVTSVPGDRGEDNGSGQDAEGQDAGIVTSLPSNPNEVPAGTLLHARIRETLSTVSTEVGTPFTAEVTEPMEQDGRVVIPVGSVIHGRVTIVRGGKRISGAAALHLLTENVTLPDGTNYIVHAQVIDTTQHDVTRVDDEGTIYRRDHIKGTLAAMSLTTGGAAAAGAVIGGVPGALIGGGIGAGVSTVWWLKQDRQEVIPQNTGIVFSLSIPMSVTPITLGTR